MVETARPDLIYHLAAQSSVQASFADPIGTLHNNTASLINLLEAVRTHAPRARVLIVSSSEIYGRAMSGDALDEGAPLRPENPYAVSKAAQDLLGYQYFIAHQLSTLCACGRSTTLGRGRAIDSSRRASRGRSRRLRPDSVSHRSPLAISERGAISPMSAIWLPRSRSRSTLGKRARCTTWEADA